MISNLKNLRQAANMTQKELAEKTGVSQQKISELERNVPSYVEAVLKICSVLGCKFEDVFKPASSAESYTTAPQASASASDNDRTGCFSHEIPIDCITPKTDYYIQLKSIRECREDLECKDDVENSWIYGINVGTYKELAERPIKAYFDGVRFLIGDMFGDVYVRSAWRLAPKFVKRVWALY